MNILLDTHLLLWAAGAPERLSAKARSLVLATDSRLFFSAASLWEITVKHGLGRTDFSVDPRRLWRMLLINGYTELAISAEHTTRVNELPSIHKDPFDRMLIAQARVEGMVLLTVDRIVARYGEGVRKV